LDLLQKDLAAAYPLLRIQVLGVNWFGLESANGEMLEDKSLPWVQDVDSNQNGQSDVWQNWGTEHLDLVVLDGSGRPVAWTNLSTFNLDLPANYAGLRDDLIAAAMASQKPWQNAGKPLDVDNSGAVVPLDALIVINRINAITTQQLPPPVTAQSPPPYYDVNGDGSLTALDALLIINFLNVGSSTAAGEGELWLSWLAADLTGLNVPWLDRM
jgi:hypothetical protein